MLTKFDTKFYQGIVALIIGSNCVACKNPKNSSAIKEITTRCQPQTYAEPVVPRHSSEPNATSKQATPTNTWNEPPPSTDNREVAAVFAQNQTFGTPSTGGFNLAGDCTPTPPPPMSAAQEEQLIRNAYDYATKQVQKNGAVLGRGWIGNVTGCGMKCNEVHDAYQPHLQKYLADQLQGRQLNHYVPVTVFDSGWLPGDLSAHVYMGIGTKPQKIGEKPQLKSWTDPWRYGDSTQYKPGTGPNTPDDVIPSN